MHRMHGPELGSVCCIKFVERESGGAYSNIETLESLSNMKVKERFGTMGVW